MSWCTQAASKAPVLFSPMGQYDAEAVLLVSLADTPITLTAHQVTSMPWKQFVRLMKVWPLMISHSLCLLLCSLPQGLFCGVL